MSKRAKRQASLISFSLSRRFRRISASKPSSMTVTIIVVASAIFLYGGGLFTLIDQPPVAFYNGRQFYFLYPALDRQFVMDTVFSAMLYAIGLVGLLLMYRSTKSAFKPRQAYMGMIIGVTLILLAYLFLEASILTKMAGG